ncbi:fluoride efflux transporter CrcB [Prochlorothrix hollandica]|uniref:fluoride efflux transporter CrcB n=1 Tax=Prochlorothrix hollandica TaxID=1223 RepID=UPI0003491020|nr:fluoride efflux transporter CrcB [Prochlorothrix hollandica]
MALGAVGGALSRYYLGLYLSRFSATFPLGTFAVNVTGSFFMGGFITLVAQKFFNVSDAIVLGIATGFLGSYTTFSSYALDTAKLNAQGLKQTAILYWLGSPVAGLLALQLGSWFAKAIAQRTQ